MLLFPPCLCEICASPAGPHLLACLASSPLSLLSQAWVCRPANAHDRYTRSSRVSPPGWPGCGTRAQCPAVLYPLTPHTRTHVRVGSAEAEREECLAPPACLPARSLARFQRERPSPRAECGASRCPRAEMAATYAHCCGSAPTLSYLFSLSLHQLLFSSTLHLDCSYLNLTGTLHIYIFTMGEHKSKALFQQVSRRVLRRGRRAASCELHRAQY